MARYCNPLVGEFAAQLCRGPNRLKWSQTIGAEQLFRIVQPDREYPYDLLTDRITYYRNRERGVQRPLIPGRELLRDLPRLIEDISASAPLVADQAAAPLETVEDLARRFGVSTKTVNRWRQDGLIGRKVIFPDGKFRVAFLPDSVEFFVAANAERVCRGRQFSRLSPAERDEALRRARRMAPHGPRQEIIQRIARRTGRSPETIRYVISSWDDEHPTRAIFPDHRRAFTPQQYQQIYDAWRAGQALGQIAARFACALSTIHRAVCQMRFDELRGRKPEFLNHPSFGQPGAEQDILQTPIPESPPGVRPAVSPPPDASPYLKDLYGGELLTGEQERALFRRYNFLKFLAASEIERIESTGLIASRRIDRIEQWLTRAGQVRDRLIRANLRLVVSIAKKHHGPMTQLADLVSDGNVVLMRAVEKFDFSRGQKFSTYCSWAIMKHFARSVPESNYRQRWAAAIEPAQWRQVAADARLADFRKPRLDALRANLEEGLALLHERERAVLLDHYGLSGADRGQTLTQIGRRLGLTKERVRQIEKAALVKLRRLLGPALAEEFVRA